MKNENNPVVGTKTAMQILVDYMNKNRHFQVNELTSKLLDNKIYELLELEKQQITGSIVQGIMKDHGLPYGIEYLGKLADAEAYAENFYNETYNK